MSEAVRRLVEALVKAKAPTAMIRRAGNGYYGDFTSPVAFPIHELVGDAEAAGLHDIARRAKAGEFDGD